MIEEHGQPQTKARAGQKNQRPTTDHIEEVSEDFLYDEEEMPLETEQEEMPWIEKVADDKQYR